jgi:tetratricopeptide (TPR) repeat protein
MTRFSSALACLAFTLFTLVSAHSATDDFQEARRLVGAGNLSGALDRVESFLKNQPRDARARFLKGVILTELGRQPDAIKVFTSLTEEFPELPEPYNNLAVLYASQGQDDKARKALESAIRTHPSYATAHENLGDIYAKMAREAYDKALQLDSNNATARAKLALVRELFSQRPATGQALVKSTVGESSSVPPLSNTTVASSAPTAAPPVPNPPVAAPAPPAKPVVAAADTPPAPKAKDSSDPQTDVVKALQAWAKAWSSGDAKGYLSFYAPWFKVPGGQSRSEWEQARRERIGKGRKISVQVQNPKVTFARPEEAVVTFRQTYRSDSLKTSGMKRMTLVRVNGRWLIQQEDIVR